MPGLTDICGACKQSFPFGLPRCLTCHKPVCADCVVRMAGSVFCGRVCAHAFFFGADEDADEGQSGRDYEDE
jgi:hypothetical protein